MKKQDQAIAAVAVLGIAGLLLWGRKASAGSSFGAGEPEGEPTTGGLEPPEIGLPAEPPPIEKPAPAPKDVKLERLGAFKPGALCTRASAFLNGVLFPQGGEKWRSATSAFQKLGANMPAVALQNEPGAIAWLTSAGGRNAVAELQMRYRSKGYPAHGPGGAKIDGIVGPCVLLDTEQALLDLQRGQWP